MRTSTILLSWVLGACAPTTDPDDRSGALHMVIDHRPPGVDAANVSLFIPVIDRTATDSAATLLRSIECSSSCYVGIVGSDDAATLAVLRAICDERDQHRPNLGARTRIDAFVGRGAFAEGDAIARKCASDGKDGTLAIGISVRNDVD